MSRRRTRGNAPHGFTLLEAVVVMGIVMVLMAVALPISYQMVDDARGDSAQTMVSTFMESARNRAVAERRNFELVFDEPNEMQMVRIEVPSGDRTVIDQLVLEGNQEFTLVDSVPDTPDAYGNSAAITITGTAPVMFTSDGSLIDSAGDVTNVSVFIARPGASETVRAITISGVTGMLRSWRWRGAEWQQ
jgi:type II secretory pathway pseudopilin PulG